MRTEAEHTREQHAKKQAPMVGWFDPDQLLHTGIQVLVSDLLGTRADYRLMESFDRPQQPFDYSGEQSLWIDFVADLGDGWNSTYAVASMLAAPTLDLRDAKGDTHHTERGRILIMGGDEVYPVASRENYELRTISPYRTALPFSQAPHPELFAIPGNHDWYDGLVSFARLFCEERWIGGWKTRQKRSYFALKLPHHWWLWGVDIQLESDIDQPQLEYFCDITSQMQADDQVLLVTAEPHWIYGNIYDPRLQRNLAFLEEKVIGRSGARLRLALSGDLHHYRRHESVDGSNNQLITAGGGGAFLHSTLGQNVDHITFGSGAGTRYDLKACFPSHTTSRRLLLRDLVFPFYNLKFGILTGIVYLVIAWSLGAPVAERMSMLPLHPRAEQILSAFVMAVLRSPGPFILVAILLTSFVYFTDTHSRPYKYLAGIVHGLLHLLGVYIVSWWLPSVAPFTAGGTQTIAGLFTNGARVFIGGYLWGAFLMGVYLFLSLGVFKRHANEAFSALHIEDYKNFIRLFIADDGVLNIFPVGIEMVPKSWQSKTAASKYEPQLVPTATDRPLNSRLIDEIISIKGSHSL